MLINNLPIISNRTYNVTIGQGGNGGSSTLSERYGAYGSNSFFFTTGVTYASMGGGGGAGNTGDGVGRVALVSPSGGTSSSGGSNTTNNILYTSISGINSNYTVKHLILQTLLLNNQ